VRLGAKDHNREKSRWGELGLLKYKCLFPSSLFICVKSTRHSMPQTATVGRYGGYPELGQAIESGLQASGASGLSGNGGSPRTSTLPGHITKARKYLRAVLASGDEPRYTMGNSLAYILAPLFCGYAVS
jgi:hypothetical protein